MHWSRGEPQPNSTSDTFMRALNHRLQVGTASEHDHRQLAMCSIAAPAQRNLSSHRADFQRLTCVLDHLPGSGVPACGLRLNARYYVFILSLLKGDKLTMITLSLSKGDKLTLITLSLSMGDRLTMITLSLSKGDRLTVYALHDSQGLCC